MNDNKQELLAQLKVITDLIQKNNNLSDDLKMFIWLVREILVKN